MDDLPHAALRLFRTRPLDNEIGLARARAIEEYTSVEQALADLFAASMGVRIDFAGVAFFRINNSRARNQMLERLLRKRRADTHNLFFNSLIARLRKLDERGNQIVHWVTLYQHYDNGLLARITLLRLPFGTTGLTRWNS